MSEKGSHDPLQSVIDGFHRTTIAQFIKQGRNAERAEIIDYLHGVAQNARAEGNNDDFVDGIVWAAALLKDTDL